jgi:hypothetical protein
MFVLCRLVGQEIGRILDLDGAKFLELPPDGHPGRILAGGQAVKKKKPRGGHKQIIEIRIA